MPLFVSPGARVRRRAATLSHALLALAAGLAAAPVPAQGLPPDGHYLVGTFSHPAGGWPFPGASGVFLVHPRTSANPVPVTGLPASLVGSTAGGVWSMSRVGDGAVFVAEVNVGVVGPARIHEFRLAGSVATMVRTHVVGTTNGVLSCAARPDGTVLIGAENMTGGPMAGQKLGILDPATSIVTPVPTVTTVLTGGLEAVAVDATGSRGFVVLNLGGTGSGALVEVSLPSGTPAIQRATFANRPRSVAVDNAGRVAVATHQLGGGVFVWDPLNPTAPPVPLPGLPAGGQFAVAVEHATGNFVLGIATGATVMSVGFLPAAGPLTVLTNGPAAGWGTVRGLVALDDPVSFGASSTCVSTGSYAWATAPNPGGLPLPGNAAFSITMQSPSPQAACLVGLSFGTTAAPLVILPCGQLLLDPATLSGLLVGASGAGTTFTLPLGLPNTAGLAGLSLFAQTFHLVGPGLATVESSPGLRVTVL